jgi:hypothetical protein
VESGVEHLALKMFCLRPLNWWSHLFRRMFFLLLGLLLLRRRTSFHTLLPPLKIFLGASLLRRLILFWSIHPFRLLFVPGPTVPFTVRELSVAAPLPVPYRRFLFFDLGRI